MPIKISLPFIIRRIFIISGLAFIGIFFSSCNLAPKNNSPYYKITQWSKDYCFFDTGSNWTYLNDKTGITYHLSITELKSYIGFHIKDQASDAYSYDAIEMLYDTGNSLHFSKGLIAAGPTPVNNEKSNDLFRIFKDDGSFILAFAPGYPMGEEQRLGGQEGVYTNIESLPNFSLNNKDYSDVYHTQVVRTETTTDSVKYEFYFAPHTGLIKWLRIDKGDTTSYSLTEAHIVQ